VRLNQAAHICLLMSGRPSIYRSALQLLSKQLRPKNSERISLFALFWEPVDHAVFEELSCTFERVQLWSASAAEFSGMNFQRKPDETNAGNFLSMQAGRQMLLEQLMSSDDFDPIVYDAFCYTRPDVCLNDQIAENLLENLADGNIYVPKNGHWRNGVNDQFVLGRFPELKTYLSLYSRISSYYHLDRISLHPELMLHHHLKMNNLIANKLSCENVIFRSEFKFAIG
jgi:hypothetical protein